MLDIKFIKANADLVKQTIKDKQIDLDLDELLKVYENRNEVLSKLEKIRAEKNSANKDIVKLEGDAKQELINKMKETGDEESKLDIEYNDLDKKYKEMMWCVPQFAKEGSIVGGEEANKVLYTKGEIPKFDFEIKDHIQLGKDLDIIDFETGVKVMGNRGYYLKKGAAILEFALMQHGISFLRDKGYEQMSVPVLAYEKFFYGTGHLPFGGDEIFKANDKHKDFGLVGTAEIPLCAYFADKTFKEEELPIRVMALSPSFRTEIGSYGKDTKGLYRVKQFYKIEQLIVCKNDEGESMKMFDELLRNSEEFLQDLDLPYHVLEVATGDMGAGKYKMYDIETYMPSRKKYGETHSCSSFLDWQARRSNIKYSTKDGKKKYAHTLNNTLIASPRILISLLELNQQKDGSVVIPGKLRKYCGFDKIIK